VFRVTGRRGFLKSILGFFLAVPAGGLVDALDAAGPGGLLARRHGAYFLVDGWVLTAGDLRALGVTVPR
jgi:hypothetical protein